MRPISKADPKQFKGKTVLLRIDLNIEQGMPLDGLRLAAAVPVLKHLAKHAAGVVVLSHRGRPLLLPDRKRQGKPSDWTQFHENRSLSLKPFVKLLGERAGTPVRFVPYERFYRFDLASQVRSGGVWLLENLRFHLGEERNDRRFAGALAKLGDYYVNDAFAVSHRVNASVCMLPKLIPSYAGFRLEEELARLGAFRGRVGHPFTLVIGGAKIAEKIGMVERFSASADYILLAGGPANTFFKASGIPVGDSLVDDASLSFAKKHLTNPKIQLPVDVKVHARKILDVGEATAALYAKRIAESRTIIWNGPLGFIEQKTYAHGTTELWRAIASNRRAVTVVGGGETTASLALVPGLALSKNVFLSTGGGAMLEYLAGKKLPGIEAMK